MHATHAAGRRSWNIPRAVKYREINKITGLRGTAVNVQTMVYGNVNDNSGTGAARWWSGGAMCAVCCLACAPRLCARVGCGAGRAVGRRRVQALLAPRPDWPRALHTGTAPMHTRTLHGFPAPHARVAAMP
jgi:hypothetical protein